MSNDLETPKGMQTEEIVAEAIASAISERNVETLDEADFAIETSLQGIPQETRNRFNARLKDMHNPEEDAQEANDDLRILRDADRDSYTTLVSCLINRAKVQIARARLIGNTIGQEMELRKYFRSLLTNLPAQEGPGNIAVSELPTETIRQERTSLGIHEVQPSQGSEGESGSGRVKFSDWARALAEQPWEEIVIGYDATIARSPIIIPGKVAAVMREENPTEEDKKVVLAWLIDEDVGNIL
jgi:hypothetical protein